ncbi:MAG: hypothetical protein AAF639_30855 [Chloroflexota bacterium]
MHTTTRIYNTDFHFGYRTQSGVESTTFAALCPDYHPLDRVAVVSPSLADGPLAASYALLALTTAFYDTLRARRDDFFDYPQHFAFFDATQLPNCITDPQHPQRGAWSWLDVWPDNKWAITPSCAFQSDTELADAMLKLVFDYQINRIFWPILLKPASAQGSNLFPHYGWKMLRSHVKSIYYYGDVVQDTHDDEYPQIEVSGTVATQTLINEVLDRLPSVPSEAQRQQTVLRQVYQRVDVDEFLVEGWLGGV